MSPQNWPRNRLLLVLSASNLKKIMPQLDPIPCERGQVLLDADSALDEIYFPDSGVISVVAVYEDGSIAASLATPGQIETVSPTHHTIATKHQRRMAILPSLFGQLRFRQRNLRRVIRGKSPSLRPTRDDQFVPVMTALGQCC